MKYAHTYNKTHNTYNEIHKIHSLGAPGLESRAWGSTHSESMYFGYFIVFVMFFYSICVYFIVFAMYVIAFQWFSLYLLSICNDCYSKPMKYKTNTMNFSIMYRKALQIQWNTHTYNKKHNKYNEIHKIQPLGAPGLESRAWDSTHSESMYFVYFIVFVMFCIVFVCISMYLQCIALLSNNFHCIC